MYLPVEKKSGNFYFKLNENETLKNSLKYKEVIEYPTIHVSLEPMNQIDSSFEEIIKNRVKDQIDKTFKTLPKSFGKRDEKPYYKPYKQKEPYPKKTKKE